MAAHDPIEAYLRSLERELRLPRRARRRILAEVRAHLADAAEDERSTSCDETVAAQRAVVRVGLAAETARQFNRVRRSRHVALRRAALPSIAAAALTLLGTATVWAFQPDTVPPRLDRHPRTPASRRAPARILPADAGRRPPRSLAKAPETHATHGDGPDTHRVPRR